MQNESVRPMRDVNQTRHYSVIACGVETCLDTVLSFWLSSRCRSIIILGGQLPLHGDQFNDWGGPGM